MIERNFNIYNSILDAHHRINPLIIKTPLEKCAVLSEMISGNVYLKCEHLQHTGSFKCRGAMSKLTALRQENQSNNMNVITASTGNHGLAVAYAAKQLNITATVYLPKTTSLTTQSAIKALGSKVILIDGNGLQAEIEGRKQAEANKQPYISPYNDIEVIAGQGTIGYELQQQMGDIGAVFISVGGGGLISGVAGYLKSINPDIKIIGCWPENATAMLQCLKAGKIIKTTEKPTLSTSTAGGIENNSITFPLCQKLIDDYVCVSEKEIAQSIRLIAEHERWILEGAAGVAVASFVKVAKHYQRMKIAILLCGRNLSLPQINDVFCENRRTSNPDTRH